MRAATDRHRDASAGVLQLCQAVDLRARDADVGSGASAVVATAGVAVGFSLWRIAGR
jgi:hypothetical protein